MNALQFMIEALNDLDQALREKDSKLFCWEGKAEEVLENIINEHQIEAVFLNEDYTPFSRKRDNALEEVCQTHSISFQSSKDTLLFAPGEVHKQDGESIYYFLLHFSKKQIKVKFRIISALIFKNLFENQSKAVKTYRIFLNFHIRMRISIQKEAEKQGYKH